MTQVKYTYRTILTLVFICCACNYGVSQDSTYVDIFDLIETKYVRWINQVPPLEPNTNKIRKGWLKRLVIGESNAETLQKPVAILPLTSNQYLILDQGNGTLFVSKNQKLEIPKILRKKEIYFPSLVAACKLPDNSIVFTDSKLNKIFRLSEDLKQLTELNTSLKLQQPTGIAYNPVTQNIWVVETAAHRVSILDLQGKCIKSFGRRGTGEKDFNYPTSICITPKGTVFVVDALNYRIQSFNTKGDFKSMFGENGNGTGYFASPKGIATDSYGHLYVVDALFHGVQIFDKQGNYLYQFGKQGRMTEEFWMPSGIYIDSNDHIYIADSYNSRVQIFNLKYSE